MKKIFALILAAIMLLSCTAALAEDTDFVDFSVERTHEMWDNFAMPFSDWKASGVGRGIITLYLLLDLKDVRGDGSDSYNVYDSYVCCDPSDESFIVVVAYEDDSSIVIIYSRSWETGSYLMCEGLSAAEAVQLLSGDFTFTANTREDFEAIGEALQN